MRWRLDLEYDGTTFVGWQRQAKGRSVQQTVEEALGRFFGHEIVVSASGRTDSGVHARQQVISFVTEVQRTHREMMLGLNYHLPDAIACVRAVEVPENFDPRRSVRHKSYRYTWFDREARSPLRRDRVWQVRGTLDAPAMHEAIQALVGTHDCSSFRAAGCSATTTVRTIEAARVSRAGFEVHLEIEGHGFLRHMVRIVAGTLTEVGLGRKPVSHIADVLAAQDRSHAARTAPAWGLELSWVRYAEEHGG